MQNIISKIQFPEGTNIYIFIDDVFIVCDEFPDLEMIR